jgi:hypothetical protein
MDYLEGRPDVELYSRVRTNQAHQDKALAARMAAGLPTALQWWHGASQEQRAALAAYRPEFQALMSKSRRSA